MGTDAGWSSPVARQAHNLKVTGSNPVPATSRHTKPARPIYILSTRQFAPTLNLGVLTAYAAKLQPPSLQTITRSLDIYVDSQIRSTKPNLPN